MCSPYFLWRLVGMLSFGFEPIIRFWPPALLAMSPVGITRQFPDPDDRNRTSSEILGYEMASLSPPSWNGEFRLQANPQISASGLVGYVAPARITRQFQITAPHQKSYGFEPMHGPCWSSVVLRLRKSWIWLSEMASLSAVDLPVGSEVKGQCGSRPGCFTNSKESTFNIVQHRSTSFNIIIEAYSTHNLLLSLVDIEFLKPFEAFTSTSHPATCQTA